MSGFNRVYFVGGQGGFMGADGINPIHFQIQVGDGNRQWLEPVYHRMDIEPIGNIRVIVPRGPEHPLALLDACLAFAPKFFSSCPSLSGIRKRLADETRIDFDIDGEPQGWSRLRQEAESTFRRLHIYGSAIVRLKEYKLSNIHTVRGD